MMQRQHLIAFDDGGCGMLDVPELEACVASLSSSLSGLTGQEPMLPLPLYVAVATRKLLLFHRRGGR